MSDFLNIAFSHFGVAKFMHTVGGGYVTAALFVLGISAFYMLKNKDFALAKKSFIVAASFGMLSSLFVLLSGDESGYQVAQKQPMKLAAMEGLYKGEMDAGIVTGGILNPDKIPGDDKDPFLFEIKVPYALGLMATRGFNNFTPGIDDLVFGNEKFGIEGADKKIEKGKIALQALKDYKAAKDANDTAAMQRAREAERDKFEYQALAAAGIKCFGLNLGINIGDLG